jgi:selenocysteine lyase/cysteine desulfurase
MDAERLESLRAAYGRFLRPGRILLTGHSHQAWPDVAREAQLETFDDAARAVDDKWDGLFEVVAEVGRGVLARMGFDPGDDIAFAQSTHELVFRLLSAVDLDRARIVTTTSEFHSLDRQLRRLAEDGVEVVWVDGYPRQTLTERLVAALTPGTTLLAVSAVLFEDAWIVDLRDVLARAIEVGAVPLVDAYHAFNVVPIEWGSARDAVFVTAGGYKYAAFGNGISWLRVPRGCTLRPRYTGWFADFAHLADPRDRAAPVAYGPGGARFAGATFEGSPFYRARAVLAHWDRFGLDVTALRALSLRQTRRILDGLEPARDLEIAAPRDDARRGGFVTVRHPEAPSLVARLRERDVWVDSRADRLRLGPAPYLRDSEIDAGVAALVEVAAQGAGRRNTGAASG